MPQFLSPEEVALSLSQVGTDAAITQHPEHMLNIPLWEKWRYCYQAGEEFINLYLQQISKRETNDDFAQRKAISYIPAFAKAAINEVKDSIYQRIADVTRQGGPQSYIDSVAGLTGGVDLLGSTMNSFIGRAILPDLLVMGQIGVFVDMPGMAGPTLADKGNTHPYIYKYSVEDIVNWAVGQTEDGIEYKNLLLKDYVYLYNAAGLPIDVKDRYRYVWLQDGNVYTQYYNEKLQPIDRNGIAGLDIITIKLPKIPFVLFEISSSLMTDIANYQITLLNLASSDISYVLKSNFPFYVEQFDPRSENLFTRTASAGDTGTTTIVKPGESQDAAVGKTQEIRVGVASGRRIPRGLEMPRFIHPSSEPLIASMKKQGELKEDIKTLLKLTLTNLAPKMASAESKSADERGLEAGLSAIGLELEHGERQIATFWSLYEGSKSTPTVKYPEKYSLQSDKEKRGEATDLLKSAKNIPSLTYKKEALKTVTGILLGTKVSMETLRQIHSEIDKAKVIVSDPDELSKDIEQGIVSLDTASKAKNYPSGEVDKAKTDHADRVARIAQSQGQATGTPDLGGLGNASKAQKQMTDMMADATIPTRGGGK